MISTPVFLITLYGSGLKFVVSLYFFFPVELKHYCQFVSRYFSCFSNDEPAYCLFRSFLVFSLSRASLCRLMIFFFVITGIFPFTIRLNNSSDGGTPVVQCGVVRYCKRKRFNSCLHGRPLLLLSSVPFLTVA